jgi:hypothetical protein
VNVNAGRASGPAVRDPSPWPLRTCVGSAGGSPAVSGGSPETPFRVAVRPLGRTRRSDGGDAVGCARDGRDPHFRVRPGGPQLNRPFGTAAESRDNLAVRIVKARPRA